MNFKNKKWIFNHNVPFRVNDSNIIQFLVDKIKDQLKIENGECSTMQGDCHLFSQP